MFELKDVLILGLASGFSSPTKFEFILSTHHIKSRAYCEFFFIKIKVYYIAQGLKPKELKFQQLISNHALFHP